MTNSRNMVRNWTKLIIVQSIPVVFTSVLPDLVILCKFKIFLTCSVSSSWTVKTSPLERLHQISHKNFYIRISTHLNQFDKFSIRYFSTSRSSRRMICVSLGSPRPELMKKGIKSFKRWLFQNVFETQAKLFQWLKSSRDKKLFY